MNGHLDRTTTSRTLRFIGQQYHGVTQQPIISMPVSHYHNTAHGGRLITGALDAGEAARLDHPPAGPLAPIEAGQESLLLSGACPGPLSHRRGSRKAVIVENGAGKEKRGLMKRCKVCGEEKGSGGFYAESGLTCRVCRCAATRAARAAGLTQAQDRARYANPARRYRLKARRQAQAYRERYPWKILAHRATQAAVERGDLTRQGCEVCGDRAHAHHEDYGAPLAVRWLCALHHARHHRMAMA